VIAVIGISRIIWKACMKKIGKRGQSKESFENKEHIEIMIKASPKDP